MKLLQKIPYFETAALELFLALASIFFGLHLLLPIYSFGANLAASQTYEYLARVAHEEILGLISCTIGVARIVAFATSRHVRTVAIIGTIWWTFIAVCLGLGNWTSAVFMYASLFMLGNVFVVTRSTTR